MIAAEHWEFEGYVRHVASMFPPTRATKLMFAITIQKMPTPRRQPTLVHEVVRIHPSVRGPGFSFTGFVDVSIESASDVIVLPNETGVKTIGGFPKSIRHAFM